MKVFITFGQGHAHSVAGKTFDKDCVAVIEADDEEDGRMTAFKYFGGKFCFSYTEDNWKEENMSFFPRGYIYL